LCFAKDTSSEFRKQSYVPFVIVMLDRNMYNLRLFEIAYDRIFLELY